MHGTMSVRNDAAKASSQPKIEQKAFVSLPYAKKCRNHMHTKEEEAWLRVSPYSALIAWANVKTRGNFGTLGK